MKTVESIVSKAATRQRGRKRGLRPDYSPAPSKQHPKKTGKKACEHTDNTARAHTQGASAVGRLTPEYVIRSDAGGKGVERECRDDRANFPTRCGQTMCRGTKFRREDFGRVTLRCRSQRQSRAMELEVLTYVVLVIARGAVSGDGEIKPDQDDSRVSSKVEEELGTRQGG